jgi:hypothetical protein
MSASALPLAEPSPIDAARDAFEHTRRLLFPFRFERWLTLGFVAFLDQCGRGGIGGALPGAPPGGGLPSPDVGTGSGTGDLASLGSWFHAHLGLIVGLAMAALVVIVAIVALMLWIGSRATFVYIDDVATGRAEVSRPWSAHAERADSYFAWRFGLAVTFLGAIVVLVAVAVAAAVLIARGGVGGAGLGAVALVVLIPVFFLLLLAGGLSALALRDFVAPLQMFTGTSCGPAVRLLVTLVRAHPVPFLLYVLLKVVFEVAQGVLILLAACLTLCCILLPVVTQTVLQPLFFFERAWSLCLLRQMGYDLLRPEAAP